MKECKYRLPCGHCDRTNELCKVSRERKIAELTKNSVTTDDYKKLKEKQANCKHDWYESGLSSLGTHYTCLNCGLSKIEPFCDGIAVTNPATCEHEWVYDGINTAGFGQVCKKCGARRNTPINAIKPTITC